MQQPGNTLPKKPLTQEEGSKSPQKNSHDIQLQQQSIHQYHLRSAVDSNKKLTEDEIKDKLSTDISRVFSSAEKNVRLDICGVDSRNVAATTKREAFESTEARETFNIQVNIFRNENRESPNKMMAKEKLYDCSFEKKNLQEQVSPTQSILQKSLGIVTDYQKEVSNLTEGSIDRSKVISDLQRIIETLQGISSERMIDLLPNQQRDLLFDQSAHYTSESNQARGRISYQNGNQNTSSVGQANYNPLTETHSSQNSYLTRTERDRQYNGDLTALQGELEQDKIKFGSLHETASKGSVQEKNQTRYSSMHDDDRVRRISPGGNPRRNIFADRKKPDSSDTTTYRNTSVGVTSQNSYLSPSGSENFMTSETSKQQSRSLTIDGKINQQQAYPSAQPPAYKSLYVPQYLSRKGPNEKIETQIAQNKSYDVKNPSPTEELISFNGSASPQKDMKHSASFRSENPKKDYESSPTDRFLGDGNSYRYSALRSDQQQTVSTPSKTKGTSERATIPSEMKQMTTNKSIEKLPSASVFQSDEKAQPDSNDKVLRAHHPYFDTPRQGRKTENKVSSNKSELNLTASVKKLKEGLDNLLRKYQDEFSSNAETQEWSPGASNTDENKRKNEFRLFEEGRTGLPAKKSISEALSKSEPIEQEMTKKSDQRQINLDYDADEKNNSDNEGAVSERQSRAEEIANIKNQMDSRSSPEKDTESQKKLIHSEKIEGEMLNGGKESEQTMTEEAELRTQAVDASNEQVCGNGTLNSREQSKYEEPMMLQSSTNKLENPGNQLQLPHKEGDIRNSLLNAQNTDPTNSLSGSIQIETKANRTQVEKHQTTLINETLDQSDRHQPARTAEKMNLVQNFTPESITYEIKCIHEFYCEVHSFASCKTCFLMFEEKLKAKEELLSQSQARERELQTKFENLQRELVNIMRDRAQAVRKLEEEGSKFKKLAKLAEESASAKRILELEAELDGVKGQLEELKSFFFPSRIHEGEGEDEFTYLDATTRNTETPRSFSDSIARFSSKKEDENGKEQASNQDDQEENLGSPVEEEQFMETKKISSVKSSLKKQSSLKAEKQEGKDMSGDLPDENKSVKSVAIKEGAESEKKKPATKIKESKTPQKKGEVPPEKIIKVEDERINALKARVRKIIQKLKDQGLETCGLVLGIDCTASNIFTGRRSFGNRHLHDISNRTLNFYEQVLSILGSIVNEFSRDGKFPVYLFGDDKSRDRSVRPLYLSRTGSEECHGLEHALAEYRRKITKIGLSGPTSFRPLIDKAIEISKQKQEFQLLIIIGDGAVSNLDETISAIVEASNYPIAIVMVGVGDGDYRQYPTDPWYEMKKLDDMIPERKFDNFNFIHFEKNMLPEEFAEQALEELSEAYKFCVENKMIGSPSNTKPIQAKNENQLERKASNVTEEIGSATLKTPRKSDQKSEASGKSNPPSRDELELATNTPRNKGGDDTTKRQKVSKKSTKKPQTAQSNETEVISTPIDIQKAEELAQQEQSSINISENLQEQPPIKKEVKKILKKSSQTSQQADSGLSTPRNTETTLLKESKVPALDLKAKPKVNSTDLSNEDTLVAEPNKSKQEEEEKSSSSKKKASGSTKASKKPTIKKGLDDTLSKSSELSVESKSQESTPRQLDEPAIEKKIAKKVVKKKQ